MDNVEIKYKCQILKSEYYPIWDNFIDNLPYNALYSKTSWLIPITQIIKTKMEIIGCFNKSEELIGGLALSVYDKRNVKFAKIPPLTPYLGPIAKLTKKHQYENESELINICDSLINFLEKNYDFVSLDTYIYTKDIRPFQWSNWKSKSLYTYILNLESIDINQFDYNAIRQRILKARKSNIEIVNSNDIETFLTLQDKSFKRQKKDFQLSNDDFLKLYSELLHNDINLQIYIAFMNNNPLAGNVNIIYKDEACLWLAGADPEFLNTGGNQLLLFEVMQDFRQKGITKFDLCGANNRSIAYYKSKYNGELKIYHRLTKRISKKAHLFLAKEYVSQYYQKIVNKNT